MFYLLFYSAAFQHITKAVIKVYKKVQSQRSDYQSNRGGLRHHGAGTAPHGISRGEKDIADDTKALSYAILLNEFLDLVHIVEVKTGLRKRDEVNLVHLDDDFPELVNGTLLSAKKRFGWRAGRVAISFAIMFLYIFIGGAIFEKLELEEDIQSTEAYLSTWESVEADLAPETFKDAAKSSTTAFVTSFEKKLNDKLVKESLSESCNPPPTNRRARGSPTKDSNDAGTKNDVATTDPPTNGGNDAGTKDDDATTDPPTNGGNAAGTKDDDATFVDSGKDATSANPTTKAPAKPVNCTNKSSNDKSRRSSSSNMNCLNEVLEESLPLIVLFGNETGPGNATNNVHVNVCLREYYGDICNSELETVEAELGALLLDAEKNIKILKKEFEGSSTNAKCERPTSSESFKSNWNFWGACFFTMTLATTIGYGNFTPATEAGKWFSIFYGTFGVFLYIPLLAVLNNSLWVPLLNAAVSVTNPGFTKGTKQWNRWYAFVSTVIVLAYIIGNAGIFLAAQNLSDRSSATNITSVPTSNVTVSTTDHGWTYLDAVYYSVITFSTIGLGDLVAGNHNSSGQIFWFMFMAIFGLSLLYAYLGVFASWLEFKISKRYSSYTDEDSDFNLAVGNSADKTKVSRKASLIDYQEHYDVYKEKDITVARRKSDALLSFRRLSSSEAMPRRFSSSKVMPVDETRVEAQGRRLPSTTVTPRSRPDAPIEAVPFDPTEAV